MTPTAENDKDQTLENDYLKFDHPNIGYIVSGLEDASVRVGFERGIEPGDRAELRTPNDRAFGRIMIEEVYESSAGLSYFEMENDGRAHPSSSDIDLLNRLNNHYKTDVVYDTSVTVVYFHLIEIFKPCGGNNV